MIYREVLPVKIMDEGRDYRNGFSIHLDLDIRILDWETALRTVRMTTSGHLNSTDWPIRFILRYVSEEAQKDRETRSEQYTTVHFQVSPRNGALPDLLPKTPETRRSFADPHAEEEEEVI